METTLSNIGVLWYLVDDQQLSFAAHWRRSLPDIGIGRRHDYFPMPWLLSSSCHRCPLLIGWWGETHWGTDFFPIWDTFDNPDLPTIKPTQKSHQFIHPGFFRYFFLSDNFQNPKKKSWFINFKSISLKYLENFMICHFYQPFHILKLMVIWWFSH